MISRYGLLAAALLVAGAATAQDEATEDEIATLIAAMEAADCLVTTENMNDVLAASGLSDERAGAAIGAIYAEGLAEATAEGLVVLTPGCD